MFFKKLELLSNVALPLCLMCNNVSTESFKMAKHKLCGNGLAEVAMDENK